MGTIHPSAVIDPEAEIGKDVTIGPHSVIGSHARIGDECRIGIGAVIDWTDLGGQCQVGSNTILGGDPQVYGWVPVPSWVKIGPGTIINEQIAVHRSKDEGKATMIGAGCYIMTQCHIGHDCIFGEGVTVTTFAGLSGHIEVGDHAVIGGAAGIHQFVRIGEKAMVGGLSRIVQDVAPYFTVVGVPAKASGLNTYAMKKHKMKPEDRKHLKLAYRYLVRSGISLAGAVEKIRTELPSDGPAGALVAFIESSERGVTL